MESGAKQSFRPSPPVLVSGVVLLLASTVILGWLMNVPWLVVLVPGGTPMVMNMAVCLWLVAASLIALDRGRRTLAGLGGLVVLVLAGVALGQVLLKRSLGIDQLLWAHQFVSPHSLPGRMAPNATLAMTLLGLAVLLLAWGRRMRWVAPALIGVVVAFALLPILSYLATQLSPDGVADYYGMALPSAGSLMLLSVAVLQLMPAGPERSPLSLTFMAAAFGMLVALGVIAQQSNAELLEANRQVVHSHEISGAIDRLVEQVARMESSARAYALTGTPQFEERALAHQGEITVRLREVAELVENQPDQPERIVRLQELALQKMAQNVELMHRRRESTAAAAEYLAGLPTLNTRALVNLADEVRAEETRRLAEQERTRQAAHQYYRFVQAFGALFAVGLLGAALLITRREQAARRRAEDRFRGAFDDAGSGMALVGLDGRWLMVNRALCEIVGYTAAELETRKFQDITHPDDLAGDLGHVQNLITGQDRYYQIEKRYVHRAGRIVHVRLTVSLVRDEAGQPQQFVSQVEDVTHHKEMEQALRAGEERLRLFAAHAPASVAMFDREMRYLIHSSKWVKDYGLEGRAVVGRSHYEVFPEISDAWKGIHRRCLAGATEVSVADPFTRANGSVQWLSWRVQPWYDSQGAVGGIVIFTEDITERIQLMESLAAARDEALTASRLKSEFLANMSHEIRTPMNGVMGMADLLMDTPLTDEQRQMGRVIRSSGENLLTIINDILDFSKIEAGKLSIEPIDFNLGEQINQTVALLGPRAEARGLRLATDLPAGLPLGLHGDAGRIQQVLANLVGNAIKFTEHGAVTVAVRPRPAAGPDRFAFRLEVRDTGIGISAEQKPRLFQPFSQADGSTTRKYGGTGLGLAISRQLVELMGGRIGLESEPGRGSTFWVELELPIVVIGDDLAPVAPSRPVAPPEAALQLLVAEDNRVNQLVIRLLLEKIGAKFEIVSDGVEVLERLAARDFTAVLMDCQMPRLDGYETTRRIRAGAGGVRAPQVPIIALTAHAMASDREKCLAAGMNDYLAKPIRLETLQQALHRLGLGTPAAAPITPEAAIAPAAAILDPEQIAQLRDLPGREHPTLLGDVIDLFLADAPPDLLRLHGLIENRSGPATMQLAHRLAGSAANLGALALGQRLRKLEEAGRAGDWPAADRLRAELDQDWRRTREELSALAGGA